MKLIQRPFVSILLAALTLLHSANSFQSSTLLISNSQQHNRRNQLHPRYSSSTTQSSTNNNNNNNNSEESTTSLQSSSSSSSSPPQQLSSAIQSHHVAVKTRNIEVAIKFYSLLGYHVETKFVAGPARAAWLLHGNPTDDTNNESTTTTAATTTTTVKSRIELIEVPNYMLNEPEGMKRRALDLTKREELLGLNHFCLDVTNCIVRPEDKQSGGGGDASLISNIDTVTTKTTSVDNNSSSCSLYNLQEWLDDLNQLSIETFGKSLRIALHPTKRIIGRDVYEMAFIYDADGTLVELLKWSNRLEQVVGSGWEPWDGEGFVL